ncbi:MAG: hypothetical protein ACOYMV_03025 [Verrucomicrobiia bacterium]
MDAKSRAIDLLLLVFQALDFLYFPGRTVFGRGGYRFSSLEMARSVHYLTRRGLVEKRRDAEGWVYALTASGRQRLNRGIDPVARWNRRWDGRWRQVIFDLPARKKALRARLLRWLRANRFGYLQDSVWITPDPLDLSHSAFRDLGMMADMAVFMDSRVTAVSSNASVVAAAWNFKEIEKAYARHAKFLDKASIEVGIPKSPEALAQVLSEEDRLWWAALDTDPLLPKTLCLDAYPGVSALNARKKFFRSLRKRA